MIQLDKNDDNHLRQIAANDNPTWEYDEPTALFARVLLRIIQADGERDSSEAEQREIT